MSTRKTRNRRFFNCKGMVLRHPDHGFVEMLEDWQSSESWCGTWSGYTALARILDGDRKDRKVLCMKGALPNEIVSGDAPIFKSTIG